jgi:tetratricopeptide (TPR) repeat protein
MRYRRPWFRNSLFFAVPGAALVTFVLAAIVLPVGSLGLGSEARDGLAGWARDLHDGFWRYGRQVVVHLSAPTGAHAQARLRCLRGEAEEALALYQRIGLAGPADREALWQLGAQLIVMGDYDRCERYVRAADRLLDSGGLRNNLAWHYVQTGQRTQQALDLALSSVADSRQPTNVDTLAWAYHRDGQLAVARNVAREVLAFPATGYGCSAYELGKAQESSRKLLALLGERTR